MEYAITVDGLSKSFGKRRVVRDVSMRVECGRIFGFLGPNGSGKTTTIRMMCGLLTPDAGSGTCLGFDIIRQSAEIKRRVGYMTQKFSYWEDLTLYENLEFVARIYSLDRRRERVERTLDDLGLAGRAGQLAGALSGGWKQRLALAACLLHEPKLLLLDEPTAGVDPTARRDFWEELHRLAAAGVSILVSTHYMDEAERCHKLAYIAYGELLEHGTAREIIDRRKLFTFQLADGDLARAAHDLAHAPGVEQTVAFGEAMHVSGRDEAILRSTVEAAARRYGARAEAVPTGLEDAFIHLTGRARDPLSEAES